MLQTGGTHGPGVKSKFLRGTCQSSLLSSGETWPSLNAIMGTNKMAHLNPRWDSSSLLIKPVVWAIIK